MLSGHDRIIPADDYSARSVKTPSPAVPCNPSTRFVRRFLSYLRPDIHSRLPLTVKLEVQKNLHVSLSDPTIDPVCCYFYHCPNVKTSHSHFHLEHQILTPPSEPWLLLKCLPESTTVPHEIYPSPQFFNQRTLNRSENREREKYFTSFSRKANHALLPSSICCASHLLWPHFEGNALT